VKDARSIMQCWEGIGNTAKFEIVVTSETTFDRLVDQDPDDFEIINPEVFHYSMAPAAEQVTAIAHNFFERFTKLDQLASMKVNSFLNVIGVILSVDAQLKGINSRASGASLSLLNFVIGDTSLKEVKVAVWGAEAENFAYRPGDILTIDETKLTSFGGLTLSVLRNTRIENVTDLEVASCLRKFWAAHPLQQRACNSMEK
jgi:hypothetical protein